MNIQRKLKYLLCFTCVNRSEKNPNIQNCIHYTFQSLENGGCFQSNISFDIRLFESGSNDLHYLDFIDEYREKYPQHNIQIVTNSFPLDGFTNTHKMFVELSKLEKHEYDYIVWMDDDVVVCKKFMENLNAWVKRYGHLSIFTSLYVCYYSFPFQTQHKNQMVNRNIQYPLCEWAYIHNYFGSCCTIFKPSLCKYIPTHFFSKIGKPDSKFRRCVEHFFPNQQRILVPSVSFVQHMNVGSVIHQHTKGYKGHRAKNFVGINHDPKFYQILSS